MNRGRRLKKSDLSHIHIGDLFFWSSITKENDPVYGLVEIDEIFDTAINVRLVRADMPSTSTTPKSGDIITHPIIGELRFIEEDDEIFLDPKDGVVTKEGMYKSMYYAVYQTQSGKKFLRFTIHIWNGFLGSRADMRLLDNIGNKPPTQVIDELIKSIGSNPSDIMENIPQ